MSDSDDTDVLLLIPPNYFIAEAKLQQHQQSRNSAAFGRIGMDDASYRFLPPNKRAELNEVNAQLQRFQHERDVGEDFNAPSDISTISNHTVRTRPRPAQRSTHGELVHSTPIRSPAVVVAAPAPGAIPMAERLGSHGHVLDGSVLQEIDSYFDERHLSPRRPPEKPTHCPASVVAMDSNLISLSEIWGQSGGQSTIAVATAKPLPPTDTQTMSLKEEQLRRSHLERTVGTLQAHLLECQQRLSVAMEVDRSKDAALNAAQTELDRLQLVVQQLREDVQHANDEARASGAELQRLQMEMAQALAVSSKCQTEHEQLQNELAAGKRRAAECQQHADEIELQLQTSRRSEEYANEELRHLKDKLAKLEYQAEKQRARCEEAERGCAKLRQQKETLLELQHKQRQRADVLESQRLAQDDVAKRAAAETLALQRKLEGQQKTLKAHYQQQLETVVAQKLREYQAQLDKTEETLRSEAHDRERLLAERAVKQLELINEKNELELNLLQERHSEEVELYRIQLANASKKIDDLDAKLCGYKSKRADMAEQLHEVMEAQWQKALEILTSTAVGNQATLNVLSRDSDSNGDVDAAAEDNETAEKVKKPQNDGKRFLGPKANDNLRKLGTGASVATTKENNLNSGSTQQQNGGQDAQPIDRLQAYIELLLSKSPSDFDKLEEILALSRRSKTKAASDAAALKRNQNHNSNKPPWKA